MTAPRLIGLAGYARSGKDTVGAQLCDVYGFERRAFADKLRELAWLVWPGWAQIVADVGYEMAKDIEPDIRSDLVLLGAGARKILGGDVWLNATLPKPYFGQVFPAYDKPPICVTDVRYPNEAQRIVDLGGTVIYIARHGIGPANDEEARTIADLRATVPHRTLVNVGGLDDLFHAVNDLMTELGL